MENPKPLAAKDTNTKVATVRPVTKLPQPQSVSKLRAPQASRLKPPTTTTAVKRPLPGSSQQNGTNKRSRLDTTAAPSTRVTRTSSGSTGSRTTTGSRTGSTKSRTSSTSGMGGRKTARPTMSRTNTTKSAASRTTSTQSRVASKPAANRVTNGRMTGKPGTASKASAGSEASGAAGKKTKRPAWDLKGRLEDMEKEMRNRVSIMTVTNDRLQQLEDMNAKLEGTVVEKEEQTSEASETIRQLKRRLQDSEEELSTSTRRLQQKLEDIEYSHTTLQRKHTSLESDFAASTQECAGLKTTVAQLTSAQAGVQTQLSATQLNLQQAIEAGKLKDEEIANLKDTIARHETTIQEKETKIREDESVRRKLHNTIQELKGNIRVFCRVRPLLGPECEHGEEIQHLNFPDDDGKVLEMDKVADCSLNESAVSATRRSNGKYEFQFDKVFSPTSRQQDVFEEISQLVQSSLDGYNVCIFAYGQTGSGKTYTMEGPDDPDELTMGMIPRAVQQVFDTAHDLESKGWQYEMEASFVEIYNETIRDLLGSSSDKSIKHDIKMVDPKKTSEVEVTNLERPIVKTQSQVAGLLKKASHNRAVAATNCNERSSRSHSVFCLKLSGSNQLTGEKSIGTLNLVDLAGSERLSQSGSTGDRLRETKCINKSLSNLGNVIMALGNKESHIPYRNSKLTHMLQHSLGGNSKTLMFVNVSPKEDNFQESLCSLRFATKVNQCNIGTAQKKVK